MILLGPLPLPGAGRGVIVNPPTNPIAPPVRPPMPSSMNSLPIISSPPVLNTPINPLASALPGAAPVGFNPGMMGGGMMAGMMGRPQMIVRPMGGGTTMMMINPGLAAPMLLRPGAAAMVAPTLPDLTPAQKKLREEKQQELQKKADQEVACL